MDVKVNFEAKSSLVCIFFSFSMLKRKKIEIKTFFYKIYHNNQN